MPMLMTEGRYPAEYLISEGNGHISREAIVVASGADLEPGTVLGRIVTGSATAAAKAGGNTGNGTISAVTVLAGGRAGVYTVRFTAATAFTVEDPDGNVIGSGATGAAFSDDVSFTITAGGTAFVAGDGFDITVGAGNGKYTALTLSATNGAQVAAGILYGEANAAAADADAVAHVRHAEVKASELVWPAGITTNQRNAAIAQLAALAIILR